MSKVIAAIVATTGAATASVGGVYILNRGSGTGNVSEVQSNSRQAEQKTLVPAPVTLDKDLATFTKLDTFESGKGGSCVNHVFGNLEFSDKGESIAKDSQISGVNFSDNTSSEVKSCLVVNWEKTSYSDSSSTDNWKGYFRWVWSFSAGDKGFVMFLTTKENSLELDGGFYYMENSVVQGQDQVKKGSIKKNKKVEGRSITGENFDSSFPTAGTLVSASLGDTNKTNWGFVKDKTEIGKFCSDTGCSTGGTTLTPFKESGLWKKNEGSSDSKITSWMGNFEAGFKEIFGEGSLNLDSFNGSWDKANSSQSQAQ